MRGGAGCWLACIQVAIMAIHGIEATAAEPVFPGRTWTTREPAVVGLDPDKLDQFARRVGGVGCVIKDGYMVKSWGDATSKADWASASKPVLSTLLFFAVHEGKVPSVDAPIRQWWDLSEKDRTMTFRHLADMVGGYNRGERPGQAWAYNDYGIRLYGLTLVKVFHQPLDEAIRRRLEPLEFEDGSLFTSRRGMGLSTTPRDFARIGWFWLNRGNWKGRQLLPREFFERYMRPDVPGDLPHSTLAGEDYLGIGTHGGGSDQTPFGPGIYGFNWWFNATVGESGKRNWPDAPPDTIQANGHWNQELMTIIPSLGLVAAARGNWGSFGPGDPDSGLNQTLKLLAEIGRDRPGAATRPSSAKTRPPDTSAFHVDQIREDRRE
jgi:CubicO group peptidase (beta-lactamase class C family)